MLSVVLIDSVQILISIKHNCNMQALHLPSYKFRTKTENGKTHIFDALRKTWLVNTPEEWVRQHFLRFLIEEHGYPAGRIGTEVTIVINKRKLRMDAVVYDKYGDMVMLMEFKAPSVKISESVFAQIADYNTKVGAKYIIVSNGISHFVAQADGATINLLQSLPDFSEL